MDNFITIWVRDDKAESVKAEAFSRKRANIYIEASTMEKAQSLLPEGLEKAEAARLSWTPKEEPEPAPKDGSDEAQKFMESFEASRRGGCFARKLKESRSGLDKLSSNELYYAAYSLYSGKLSLFYILGGLFSIGYERGMRDAKKKGKV